MNADEAAIWPTVSTNAAGLPLLQSRPNGAGLELFIDFAFDDGYYHAYSTDGDRSTYNFFEQRDIYNAWRDVAAAFSMLDVNVTTVLPQNNHNFGWLAVSNEFVWGAQGAQPGIGQTRQAFAGSRYASDWNWTGGLAHEFGHNFGMWHHSDYDYKGDKVREYTNGEGYKNRFFMGSTYYGGNKYRFAWARTSEGPWAVQDQIASALYWITQNIGGDGYRPDDVGNTTAAAVDLGNGMGVQRDGYLERPGDADVFKITPSATGVWSLNADPMFLSSARPTVELLNSSGQIIAVDDAAGMGGAAYEAALNVRLTAGQTYYVRVQPNGDYGGLGYYNFGVSRLPTNFAGSVTIGDPSTPGSAVWNGTKLTQIVGGNDIWNNWDQEQLTYSWLNGNGSITARIDGVDNSGTYAKAGIQIRQSAAGDAAHVYFGLRPNGAFETISRATAGANSANPANVASGGNWVRITRSSNTFTFFKSTDGTNWTNVGTTTVSMTGPVMIGLASTAWNGLHPSASTFSNISVTGTLSSTASTPSYNTLSAPSNVAAAPASGQTTDINVTWNGVANATGYAVSRSENGVDFTQIATTASNVLSYRDNGVGYFKRWFYRVQAIGSGSTRSTPSATVNTVNRPAAPGMTWGYTSPDVIWSGSEIFLNWIDTHGETGYKIERSLDGVNYTLDHTVPANHAQANVGNLTAGELYWFRITPTSAIGDGPSTIITSQTRLANRTADNLAITNRTATSITVDWATQRVPAQYRVERSTDGTNWSFIGDFNQNDSQYVDTNVAAGGKYYYRVMPFNQFGNGAMSNPVFTTAPAAGLPSGWTAQDIGGVGGAGTTGFDGTTWTQTGSGNDIWGTADQFQFASRTLTGDGSITTRLTGQENIDAYTKSGIMMRESTAAGSKYVYLHFTPAVGTRLETRETTNGNAGNYYNAGATLPAWYRLTRVGNLFTALISNDGTNWTSVASRTISMNASIQVGMATTSHNNSRLATSTYTNVTVA